MTSQFQNIFENVCRCFGHTPSSVAGGTNGNVGDGSGNTTSYSTNSAQQQQQQQQQQQIEQVNSTTSAGARRRTNRLELKDKQWDELFEKNQQGSQRQQQQQQQQQQRQSSNTNRGQPPRPEGYSSSSCAVDHETAEALAKVKLAANPPRYRTKRKRSAQAREEIFRTKDDRNPAGGGGGGGGGYRQNGRKGGGGTTTTSRGCGNNNNTSTTSSSSYYTPQTDFSRLLNPSLALCFATPVRGTEEEPDETDMKSVDNNSDTATLNTNGEDTITSTLYFDSKYAHIPETRPPMPLFNQFKIGQAKDEIRTIMATDSHSSLRMIKLMQQQQQQQQQMTRDEIMETRPEAGDSSSSEEDNHDDDDDDAAAAVVDGSSGRRSHRTPNNNSKNSQRKGGSKGGSRNSGSKNNNIKKDGIVHHDEEMQDAVPDVKAVSSSTDSSRLSNAATKQHTV
ncbi:hypothetical protein IV203_016043 [Nitzschia inconspicua]|uniref:Uncharacterized protein n=1 Tax=Nitzschia inconspicua TaxID=303405 RepID=A0A9K3PHA1_9STRA|nr:hypothetical protein IV203_016043 [Nitzschia inconspicua]